ncbi:MAG: translation elongation factor 4 [Bdellovibrionota bacterium]
MNNNNIRNFSIIAHIDHGKSTLADRILEKTGALEARQMQEQFLDRLDLERERGITIKAQTVSLKYTAKDGKEYELNLIDTPGHVDFNYEVSRSLAACEGALLVIDATQGVEAQTLANVYLAIDNDLEIIPVLNKIDLASADIEKVKAQIEDIIGIDASKAILISAKTGQGVEDVLEAIVERVPAPKKNDDTEQLRALVYDSWFDSFLGAVVQVRVVDGVLREKDKIQFMSTKSTHEIYKMGVFAPQPKEVSSLKSGEVGYFSAAIKNLSDVKIGDTVTLAATPAREPLAGFKEIKSVVFGGLFPIDTQDYQELRSALEKLSLNDASFTYEPESSVALGFGFRCGYLGLLHMEVIRERLEGEFNLSLISTAPTVVYKVHMKNGTIIQVDNPSKFPNAGEYLYIEEPVALVTIHTPEEYVGNIIKLCEEKRGVQDNMHFYSNGERAVITYDLPLNEIILDFHDRLKSLTKGYASFDYELKEYRKASLVKLDIRVNEETVDALSTIVHKDKAFHQGQALTEKLKELIDRQMFVVPIQAVVGGKVIARSTVKALRKNVLAKCYGGDISRKRKLLEKQKEGKKKMKKLGKVSISQDAFLAVLKAHDN